MKLLTLLRSLSPIDRRIAAIRCGVPSSSPEFMTEILKTSKAAYHLFRRVSDSGAGTLMRATIEHAGNTVPFQSNLQYEARIMSTFFFLQTNDLGWFIPGDLAAAMFASVTRERFFAASLLNRLPNSDIFELLNEYDLSRTNARPTQIYELSRAIAEREHLDDRIKEASEQTKILEYIENRLIDDVQLIQETSGLLFKVTIVEKEYTITPREIAKRFGVSFSTAEYVGREPPEWTENRSGDKFKYFRVGGIVSFSTSKNVEEALLIKAFADQILMRLDSRRLALQVNADMLIVNRELGRLGFLKQDTQKQDPKTIIEVPK